MFTIINYIGPNSSKGHIVLLSQCHLAVSIVMLWNVPLNVQRQMVGAGKAACTYFALEWLVAAVFPVMACKFIGPGELPITIGPVAFVWLLA